MKTFNIAIAQARYLTFGLGLLATSLPAFAQVPPAPATPAQATAVEASPVSVTDPQAKALLAQTIDRYNALKSLSVLVERNGRTQLVEFQAPGSVRISGLDAKGEKTSQQLFTEADLIVLQKPNDTYEWTSNPRPAAPEGVTGRARVATIPLGGSVFPSFLAGVDPFREGARYKATSYTLGVPTTVDGVTLAPVVVTTEKSERLPETTLTFGIGKDDHLIHTIQTNNKLANGREVQSVEKFTTLKPDTQFAETYFNFTAPEGATKVEKFSRPQVRAVVGQAPLDLNTKDLDGKEINFEQYKGKVVLVDFWATWCGPCIAELPNVKANYEKYKGQGFDVLGISLDQSTEPLTKYIKNKDIPWRQVYDGYWDGPIATSYNVRAIPSTLLIGKDGKIAAIGVRGEQLEPAIQAALAVP